MSNASAAESMTNFRTVLPNSKMGICNPSGPDAFMAWHTFFTWCARVMRGDNKNTPQSGPGRLKNSNSSRRDTSSIQTIFRPFFWILFGTFRFAAVKAQSTWWIGTRGRHVWSNWKTQASVNPGVKTCNQAVYTTKACLTKQLTPPKLKRMNNQLTIIRSTDWALSSDSFSTFSQAPTLHDITDITSPLLQEPSPPLISDKNYPHAIWSSGGALTIPMDCIHLRFCDMQNTM